MAFSISSNGIRGIVLDIEGTTTPIAFVFDVLFPFVRLQLPGYLRDNFAKPEVHEIVRALRLEHAADLARNLAPPQWTDESESPVTPIVAYVHWLMDQDRKSTALKALQGLIWRDGYRSGRLRGEVFADVPPALARWQEQQIDVRIYSSGSELAQRLLFGSTSEGDLTRLLHGYFDTAIGAKIDPASYRTIATAFGLQANRIISFPTSRTNWTRHASAASRRCSACVRETARRTNTNTKPFLRSTKSPIDTTRNTVLFFQHFCWEVSIWHNPYIRY